MFPVTWTLNPALSNIHTVFYFLLFICMSLFLLSDAIFLPQAMDLYYHNESDPDSYCCPGDNSKSPATKPVVLYSFTSSSLSFPSVFHAVTLEHRLSYLSPSSFAISLGSFLFIICTSFFLFSQSIQSYLLPFILCLFFSCLFFPFHPNLTAHTHLTTSL